jgi:putative transcriptional regulator
MYEEKASPAGSQAEKVGITMANISELMNGKVKASRLSTFEAICRALDCQPGDILEYKE